MTNTHPTKKSFLTGKSLAVASLALLCTATSLDAQRRVDLRNWQTSFKNQGGRRTCTQFCSIAALEAAYRRAGYGTLDLSEEFLNYMTKLSWLNNTPAVSPLVRENQASWAAGGSGGDMLGMLTSLRVPRETDMPYRPSGYTVPNRTSTIYWNFQKNINDFALDQRNLPRRALTASRYYGVTSFRSINARNTSDIEAALRSGKEVLWDFAPDGNIVTHRRYSSTGTTTHPAIWQTSTRRSRDSHCMLIVGYDRSSSDPNRQYFICKNHWGRTGRSYDGYSYVSYSYLRAYGQRAHYITGIRRPAAWPEVAAVGRYNLSFDGHRATLDVTRVPGSMQWRFNRDGVRVTDRRLGTITLSNGRIYRVNGWIQGDRIRFWFKSSRPVMTYDEQRESPSVGRMFTYYVVDKVRGEIAGYHHDNPGALANPAWGGYGRIPSSISGTTGFLRPVYTERYTRPEMHLGLWACAFNNLRGQISVQYRADHLVESTLRAKWAGLRCEFIEASGRRQAFTALVNKSRPAEIFYKFPHSLRGNVSVRAYMLSWQKGVTAGDAYAIGRMATTGFYAYRIGTSVVAAEARLMGKGCTGSNGAMIYTVVPPPSLGRTSTLYVSQAPKSGLGILAIGNGMAPWRFPGTPDCFLRVAPITTKIVRFSSTGRYRELSRTTSDRRYLGAWIYTQVAAWDRTARGGMTLSNAIRLRIGGYR